MKSIKEEELSLEEEFTNVEKESSKLRVKEEKLSSSRRAVELKLNELEQKKETIRIEDNFKERRKELDLRVDTVKLLQNEFPHYKRFNSTVDSFLKRVNEYLEQEDGLSLQEKTKLLNSKNTGSQYRTVIQTFSDNVGKPAIIIDYTIKIQALEKRLRVLEGK